MTDLTDQIAQVRALALEVEQKHGGSRRRWEMRSDYLVASDDEVYRYVALANDPTYSRYLVAVQPAFTLAVLARLDAAERQVATLRAALQVELDTIVLSDRAFMNKYGKDLDVGEEGTALRLRAALAPQPASETMPVEPHSAKSTGLTSTDMSQTVAPSESRSESAGGMVEGGAE